MVQLTEQALSICTLPTIILNVPETFWVRFLIIVKTLKTNIN